MGPEEKNIVPTAGAPGELQVVLDVVERSLDLRNNFAIDFVRFTVPTAYASSSLVANLDFWLGGKPTLSSTLDNVANTDSLAVPEILLASLAIAFVTGVCEMRHNSDY